MDETPGFGKIEAKGEGAVGFKTLAGLNGKTFFVQVDQFAEIDNEAGLRSVEAGVDGVWSFWRTRRRRSSFEGSGFEADRFGAARARSGSRRAL